MSFVDVASMAGIMAAPSAVAMTAVYFASKPGRPLAPKPPYSCARCDKPRKTWHPLTRCAPCEETVEGILLQAASEGRQLEDPLAAIRNRMI